MAAEFRLLGDFEVRIDGRAVDVGHARQRCVLLALLVDANRVVSLDQLTERVWADRLPQRARGALYNYVSRLRRILAVTDDVVVSRQSGGYVLAVDPLAVDLHLFQHLTERARAADDDGAAAALFARALGLWRGKLGALLDTPWLNDIRNTMDNRRLAAELDRNDIELRRGKHSDILDELVARAAALPLDERLAGQVMLALYRCGRQADALDRYQKIRLRLADDLGVDPSPPLGRLYHRILAADAALDDPTPRLGGLVRQATAPRQLPAPPRSFTGRASEVAQLDAVLAGAGEPPAEVIVMAVSGTAGVGKTALATYWAHRVAAQFPDGQLYLNLRGFDPGESAMDPVEALHAFLEAFAVPADKIPAGQQAQTALFRSLLADKRVLLLLDNARDAQQIRPLLPGTPGCLVVVTSRNQLGSLAATEEARILTLAVLSTAEAEDLVAHRVGADRVAAEPDAVRQIIAYCARLPLALTIVAARAATHPGFSLTALAAELRDATDGLDNFDGGDPATDVRAVFSWSYHTLSADAARLFRLLGLHPGPDISAPAAASLAGLPHDRVRRLLVALTRAHLLTEHVPGRYTFHDLLRVYAGEQAGARESETGRRAAHHRMLDHYLHTAQACASRNIHGDPITLNTPQPGVVPEWIGDDQTAQAWLATEYPILRAAVGHAAGHGYDTHAWQLASTLTDFLERRGYWQHWISIHGDGLDAARRLADQTAQAQLHRGLGRVLMWQASHDEARRHFGAALVLFESLHDQVGEARTHHNLCQMSDQQGRSHEALDHAHRALKLYQSTGDEAGMAKELNSIGWCHATLGDFRQTLEFCRQALVLQRKLGDRSQEGPTWDSLGYAYHHLGHHPQAIDAYRRAIDISRDLGNRAHEAKCLIHLGDSYHSAGALEDARNSWQHAVHILDELGPVELGHGDADRARAKLLSPG
jgi:DNA-binding SARP family transcriptional activator/tetratricopeptide (TPR) repeat protein